MSMDEDQFPSLNLSGIDLDNLDIDHFVINNKDFLDCSFEDVLQKNIENMSHYFEFSNYQRVGVIKNSITKMLAMIQEVSCAPDLLDTHIQFLVEEVNKYLSLTNNFTTPQQFFNKRTFLSITARLSDNQETPLPYAAMYSPLSSFSPASSPYISPTATPTSTIPPPSATPFSSLSFNASPSPSPSLSLSRKMMRKNSIVGVEVVNLVLRSKGSPRASKRVVEGGSEEVTLLLGRRPPRPQLQVREKEEVNLAISLGRKAVGLERREEKREERRERGIKTTQQEVTLVLGKGDQVVSMSILEENESVVEEVNLALSPDTSKTAHLHMATDLQIANLQVANLHISDLQLSPDLQPEAAEEVTLSLSADMEQLLGKEWTVENVNKYGSVLMAYASQPLQLQVRFQNQRCDTWNEPSTEQEPSTFFGKVEVIKRNGEVCELEAITPEKSLVPLPYIATYTFERHERGINFVLVTIYYGIQDTRELVCCTLVPAVVI
eukprot:Phypoly_transcript_07105.p1 GENE.Phypoly_transcript_07105~~Phypoly_transcript_07105.p1  ORF type:complete len:493 (+),score=94.00 Phypoly_transcript_07105:176-1654(+)